MLGRVRPPSSSSLERPPSKIIKDDSLSIYEATLVKLRPGSRCNPVSPSDQAMKIDVSCDFASNSPHDDEAMTEDTNCSSNSISSNCSDYRPMGILKEQQNKMRSVTYLFARYRSSQHTLSLPAEAVMVENKCCSASSSLSAKTADRWSDTTGLQLQQECVDSVPAFQMLDKI
ncbi:hypothetical protein CsSME_00053093 [Camellia sinensis var. sinensis]